MMLAPWVRLITHISNLSRLGRGVLLALMGALAMTHGPSWAATYTVAVVPQFPALEIHRAWAPLLAKVSAVTGDEYRLMQSTSIPQFEDAFMTGSPDFVYLNPYHMLMAAKAQRYVPLVREEKNLLSGVLVVAASSPIQSLADLEGKDLAFPAPNAFGASLYLRALLTQKKIHFTPRYVGTHSNAYRNVLSGQAAAAGGVRATLAREPEDVRQQLRVLFETPAVPPHPLAVHPRVKAQAAQAFRDALLALAASPEGKALLIAVQMPNPIAADYRRDYAPLEQLRLDRFSVVDGD
jgi:phosphonate transport system substrate-binding protein